MGTFIKDLIGVYENAISNEWCDDLIKIYKNNQDKQMSRTYGDPGMWGYFQQDNHIGEDLVPSKYKTHLHQIVYNHPVTIYFSLDKGGLPL